MKRETIALWVPAFVVSMALYGWTLAPTVTLVDSGELIVAVHTLGVAHPPGFPLYILLAHLVSLLPLGQIALRVNFASAFFGALAAAAASVAIFEALSCAPDLPTGRDRNRKKGLKTLHKAPLTGPAWLPVVAGLSAGLLFCVSRTLWAYSTITEVYSLNTFLIILIVFLMLRWHRLCTEARRKVEKGIATERRDHWLYAAAFIFGLALGVHHVTVGLLLPSFAVLAATTEGRGFFVSRKLAVAAGVAVAGTGIYAYLPVAASRSPLINWGNPDTFARFFNHITGWQYRVYFEAQPELMGRQIADFFLRLGREFGPPWMPLVLAVCIIGFFHVYRRNRALFWLLVTAIGVNLMYNVNYEIAEDKDAYYLPVFLMVSFAAGFGLQWILERTSRRFQNNRPIRAVAAMLLIAVPGTALAANYGFNSRRNYWIAKSYVENILAPIPKGGMLLTLDWQVYSPAFYLREIESYRRDAVVIDVNQLRRPWYFVYLEKAYPETMNGIRPEINAFLEDLNSWEQNPDLYDRDPELNRRISSRGRDLILALIRDHSGKAPVFVTGEIATYPQGETESYWIQPVLRSYALVPDGLVFRLATEKGFQEPSQPKLDMKGLIDGTLRFEADDVVRKKVLPVYASMSYNRGRYLAVAGRHLQAIDSFREALAFDPGMIIAQQALAESESALRRH